MCAFSYSTNCKEVNHDKSFINDSLQTFPGLILFFLPWIRLPFPDFLIVTLNNSSRSTCNSAQGPEECCLAVKKALDRLIKEAARQDVAVTVLETETGRYSDTLRSALISLDGDNAWALSESWCGTIQ